MDVERGSVTTGTPTQVSLPAADGRHGDELTGDLVIPETVEGLVLFVHGSGSSRHSSRNRWVAQRLQQAGFATLLMDLLTDGEEERDARNGHLRFDIDFLTQRVLAAVDWLGEDRRTSAMPLGLFGASTGGAAALEAAVHRPQRTRAVVSRGGRPDLAAHQLEYVRVPTLLIVGGADEHVLALNRDAASRLHTENDVHVVEGATHLFEEPGALQEVSETAGQWFHRYLPSVPTQRGAGG